MSCSFDLYFDDTGSVTFNGTGTQADPITAESTGELGAIPVLPANADLTGAFQVVQTSDGTLYRMPLGCATVRPDSVAYTAGPGVIPDNSASFVAYNMTTLVCVTDDAVSGGDGWYVIQRDTAGNWQWHGIA